MTEDFKRYDNLFSLCGLNCGLCPMQSRGECPGCFKESFCAKQCPIVPCSVRHGNIQYCFECDEYPCEKYDDIDRYLYLENNVLFYYVAHTVNPSKRKPAVSIIADSGFLTGRCFLFLTSICQNHFDINGLV